MHLYVLTDALVYVLTDALVGAPALALCVEGIGGGGTSAGPTCRGYSWSCAFPQGLVMTLELADYNIKHDYQLAGPRFCLPTVLLTAVP